LADEIIINNNKAQVNIVTGNGKIKAEQTIINDNIVNQTSTEIKKDNKKKSKR
jgi:DUF4097 and DUF4098 domain-containing protein YvlB